MSQIRAFLLATVAIVALTAAGCTDSVDPNASKTTLLTNNTWTTTKYTVGGNDYRQFVQQTTTFNADGTYSATFSNKTETGTWKFNVDETNLEMTEGSSGTVNWEILTLTASSLKLRATLMGQPVEYEGEPD